MDFSAWDNKINEAELSKQINEAKANGAGQSMETPAGEYICKIEKMEVGATKTDGRPMFKVQLRVVEAGEKAKDDVTEYLSHFKNKKPCLFMNRVIGGIATTYKEDGSVKWSNEKAIGLVIGWLNKLGLESELTVSDFKNYNQFADLVLDIFEEVTDSIEVAVSYDPDAFNSISVNEVYDA